MLPVTAPTRTARLVAFAVVLALAWGAAPALAETAAEALAARAATTANRGDYEGAVDAYRAALAEDPKLIGARFQLARVLSSLGRLAEARKEFATIVAARPDDPEARLGEVMMLLLLDRLGDAKKRLEDGLRALPKDGLLAHLLARLLATAPDDRLRDGLTALELARRVYEARKSWETGETIAMAHAELGEFDRAISVQAVLITQAQERGDEKALAELGKRLDAYRANKPWRAKDGKEIAVSTSLPEPGAGARRPG